MMIESCIGHCNGKYPQISEQACLHLHYFENTSLRFRRLKMRVAAQF